MKIQTYLYFNGRCDEAIDFYTRTLGAEVMMLMRFKDAPEGTPVNTDSKEKVMHASMRIGESVIMASDGQCQGEVKFDGFALSVYATDPDDAARLFAALGDGGQVIVPLAKTFFSPAFGMLADRFGVNWMVLVEQSM